MSLSPFTPLEERDGLSTVLSAPAGTGKAELSFKLGSRYYVTQRGLDDYFDAPNPQRQ